MADAFRPLLATGEPDSVVQLSRIIPDKGHHMELTTTFTMPTPSSGAADAALAAAAGTKTWVSAPALARELGISRKSPGRWMKRAAHGFPRPIILNHRLFFERDAIEAWKRAIARQAMMGARDPA
jgi:hypothetical protein